MKRKVFPFICLLAVLVFSSAAILPKKATKIYVADYENVLGTSLEIKIAAGNNQSARKAEAAALAEIDRLNKILSGYDASSEFSRWMQTTHQPVKVSAELFEVLRLFQQWRSQTRGALDPAAETISQLWKQAARANKLPAEAEIQQAVKTVQQQHYILDAVHQTATRTSDAPLVLNSFAKSYIMHKASEKSLAVSGVQGVVVNIGGDIVVKGDHTEAVQVSDPKASAENDAPVAVLAVQNKTIATSGNYRRGVQINGKWYSHIVDPRMGKPADAVISATVIANQATDAGALATALNVLPVAEGQQLMQTVPDAEYMIITRNGETITSKGWTKMTKPTLPKAPVASPAREKEWDTQYELAINFELALIPGVRIHRPFVAVWVVDENNKPVRHIAIWYNKPKWLNDMRSWYATYNDEFAAGSQSISSTTSATRGPGKYTLKWDGKDDKGNLVKKGTYTVYIEAAREHGTYQLMKQEFTTNKAQHIDLTGNVEVASASLDYQKKPNGN